MNSFADFGIEIPRGATGPEVYTTCPKCSGDRRKRSAKCLSVNLEKGVWCCHHCDWSGGLRDEEPSRTYRSRRPQYRRPGPLPAPCQQTPEGTQDMARLMKRDRSR